MIEAAEGSAREIRANHCKTCPFRPGGWEHIRGFLEVRALSGASPVCHSTGDDALTESEHPTPLICRGARNQQLRVFAGLGFIREPTDAAWAEKCQEMGIPQPVIVTPAGS